jgi:hypothetical protein
MGGDWKPITLDTLKELGEEQYDPIDDVDDHDASLFFKTVELASGFDTEAGWRSIIQMESVEGYCEGLLFELLETNN